jgi:hypothetical protein
VFAERPISLRQIERRQDLISLSWLTRRVGLLLLVRAAHLARPRQRAVQRWRHGRDISPRHAMRSMLGSGMRRVLGSQKFAKDPAGRVASLIAILRDFDASAARLVQRFRRGLTRLCRTWPSLASRAALGAAPALVLAMANAASPAFPDSS